MVTPRREHPGRQDWWFHVYERLVVGPRSLDHGWAEVWIDTGTGPGFVTRVPADRLTLAAIDDGNGDDAIYRLHLATEDVRSIQAGR